MSSNSPDFRHWLEARNVCVLGAGTMGAGIAAHLANLGFQVSLLDLTETSVLASFNRAKAARPPHFYVSDTTDRIRLGSIHTNLSWVSDADWVCEAIVEKMDAKRSLFAALEPLLRPNSLISTNTSGLEIELLAEGRSDSFRRRFMGTHFFNPPRYLKLLELIPTQHTDPEAVTAMTQFMEQRVARRVVLAKDTPGFIANRFGMWAMFHAIHVTEKLRLTIEQVDSITGQFLGRPRTASFRLNDLVGLDIMADIAKNLFERCTNDKFRDNLNFPESLKELLERGWIGDKSGQGYYRKEGRELMALELSTMAYLPQRHDRFESIEALAKLPLKERICKALELRDDAGEFLRRHLVTVLQYANYLKEEISHSVQDFDRVMQWGFGWEVGPFGLIDMIGHEKLGIADGPSYKDGTMRSFSGSYVPIKHEPEYKPITDYPILSQHTGFNVRDLGDGVVAISLTTKMGVIDPQLVRDLLALLREGILPRIVLCSEGRSFSAGYNLKFFLEKIQEGDTSAVERSLSELQDLGIELGMIPSVAALHGHALGGGFELAMSCSQLAILAECQIGLPEAKVGLLPGGGGTARLRLRHQFAARQLADIAAMLASGVTSTSGDQARELGLVDTSDVTVYHPDRLITEAKALALKASVRILPQWAESTGPFAGMIDDLLQSKKAAGELSDHDLTIGERVKAVFKATSFEDALARERKAFLDLCAKPQTLARIRHMLENGKPLKN